MLILTNVIVLQMLQSETLYFCHIITQYHRDDVYITFKHLAANVH